LSVPDLSARWGPSLDHAEPSIDIPADDWRCRVANLPHAEWVRWRARSAEILATLGDSPHAEQTVEADRLASAEMGVAGTVRTPPQPLRVIP
jgi:hypothetical protein